MFNPLSVPSVSSPQNEASHWIEGIDDPIPLVHSGGRVVNHRYLSIIETIQRLIAGDCVLVESIHPDILQDITSRPNVQVDDIGDGRPCLQWVKLEWIPCTPSMLHSIFSGSWLYHVPTGELWECELTYDPTFKGIRLILDNGTRKSAIDDYYCELSENLGWLPIYWLTEEKAATGEWMYHVD